MSRPISNISSRNIGTVESVSPDDIKILLDIEAPQNTALNTGVPTPFPRLNNYVLLPNEAGLVVGIIVWMGIEKSQYPKQQGFKDFGLIDLPFPLRKMALAPLGMLKQRGDDWELERGITSYPSVGDQAILPTRKQTIAIVTGRGDDDRVHLGTCPSAYNANISVDPDKLFGRHLAVLGNTGSGKSCTLASLIRSSVKSAEMAIASKSQNSQHDDEDIPNTRFIILDPNGEYTECFRDVGTKCRVFKVPPIDDQDKFQDFLLPAWMWNSSEWAAIVQASSKTQRPLLQTALKNLRAGKDANPSWEKRFIRNCRGIKTILSKYSGTGTLDYKQHMECGNALSRFVDDLNTYLDHLEPWYLEWGQFIRERTASLASIRQYESSGRINFNKFGDQELQAIIESIDAFLSQCPEGENGEGITEDAPIEFDALELAEHMDLLATIGGDASIQYVSTMIMRTKSLMADLRITNIINSDTQISLVEWLENHIGNEGGKNGPIAVIDLSLVPHEILHLVIAIASRLILEALQRYRKLYNTNLPTVLVLEEAHTFISKRFPSGDDIPGPADMCRSIFERIAREGRKFGLGLVLSSQRPSELSETVLSQCNSFLLHRITNDRDQDLVSRLVPDNTRGLLRELPSLPTRHCILMGIASKIPTLVEIPELAQKDRPKSEDPDFWDVWTLANERQIDWPKIVNDWVGFQEKPSLEMNQQEGR